LVERNLAKVEVAGSIPVVRSTNPPVGSSDRGIVRFRSIRGWLTHLVPNQDRPNGSSR
jgi:hypothetical protein